MKKYMIRGLIVIAIIILILLLCVFLWYIGVIPSGSYHAVTGHY